MLYTIKPCRSVFTRRGYEIRLLSPDGNPQKVYFPITGTERVIADAGPFQFFGDDGRKTRAEAIRFAKKHGAIKPA